MSLVIKLKPWLSSYLGKTLENPSLPTKTLYPWMTFILFSALHVPCENRYLGILQMKATATTGRPSISDKMWWRNLNLSLIPMLLVTKLIFITIASIISVKLLYRHRMHLQWRI